MWFSSGPAWYRVPASDSPKSANQGRGRHPGEMGVAGAFGMFTGGELILFPLWPANTAAARPSTILGPTLKPSDLLPSRSPPALTGPEHVGWQGLPASPRVQGKSGGRRAMAVAVPLGTQPSPPGCSRTCSKRSEIHQTRALCFGLTYDAKYSVMVFHHRVRMYGDGCGRGQRAIASWFAAAGRCGSGEAW